VDNGSLAGQLTRLGLTSYEAKAYVALVRRDSSTAAQVARLAEVPRQRIYDVLSGLVERGLASTRPGRVVKYAATPPESAIAKLVAQHRQHLAELEQEAEQLVESLHPLDYIEVLREPRAINERFSELQAGIKHEILVFTKPPYAKPPQENVEGIEVTRSHTARAVYELSIFDDPDVAEGVRRFVEAGEEARFVRELPLKLVIIDETIVMFGMEDPVARGARAGDLTIVVVEHPSLAQILKVAFDAMWSAGMTFDEAEREYSRVDRAVAAG
jgi:HTH-type transcriptional regulator, sugar sensing transcriptional regulator